MRPLRNLNLTLIAAVVLLVIGLLIIVFGYRFLYDEFSFRRLIIDLYANGGSELLSIALTVLIIETLNERRAVAAEKRDLILQMGSPNKILAVEAVRLLNSRQWLQDRSLEQANFRGADLEGTNLMQAHLKRTDFGGANLRGANLVETNMYSANLWWVTLREAVLRSADLRRANLMEANLKAADLKGSNLSHANLRGANLQAADLTGACLVGADLRNADLTRTNLDKAVLPDDTTWTPDTDMRRFTDPDHPNFYTPPQHS